MKLLAILSLLLLLTAPTRAQIGMGSTTPHPSAALDVQATDKAFYQPRLTTIQRKAIVNPQPGAFIYDLRVPFAKIGTSGSLISGCNTFMSSKINDCTMYTFTSQNYAVRAFYEKFSKEYSDVSKRPSIGWKPFCFFGLVMQPAHPVGIHSRRAQTADEPVVDHQPHRRPHAGYELGHLGQVNVVAVLQLKREPVKLVDVIR